MLPRLSNLGLQSPNRHRVMSKHESGEGVSGHLSIALEHSSYAPGEVVRGFVTLSTLELVQTKERTSRCLLVLFTTSS